MRFLLLIIIAAISMGCFIFDSLSSPLGVHVIARVEKGMSTSDIIKMLEDNGILKRYYGLLYSLFFRGVKLKAGEFELIPSDSLLKVFDKIAKGTYFYRKISIPEGLTSYQIAAIIKKQEDALSEEMGDFPEGMLMPDTYFYQYGDTKSSLIDRMNRAMSNFIDREWEKRDPKAWSLTKKEALILASIIEKETSLDNERPIIAAVFLNRLAKKMRLQSCSTVVYALSDGKGAINRALTIADLWIKSPFNTYRNAGLPPEPICNPGKKAILAALHPDNVDYLFFVKNPHDSSHVFSKEFTDHLTHARPLRNSYR